MQKLPIITFLTWDTENFKSDCHKYLYISFYSNICFSMWYLCVASSSGRLQLYYEYLIDWNYNLVTALLLWLAIQENVLSFCYAFREFEFILYGNSIDLNYMGCKFPAGWKIYQSWFKILPYIHTYIHT
jgi:hypothetical protein